MTKKEVVLKAEDLTKSLGITVHPITFVNYTPAQQSLIKEGGEVPEAETDIIHGFLKEPSFLVKARAMDRVTSGMAMTAYIEILDACIIKEHTDPRMVSETEGGGKFKLGAAKYAGELLLLATDQTEKKN